jgi:hypothetical protein
MPETTAKSNVMRSAKSTVDRFNESWEYAKSNHHQRWDRNWKLYNNKRAMVGYKGITNTFVPITFSTVETITAALCSGRPSIDFIPQDMYKYLAVAAKMDPNPDGSTNYPDLKALNAKFDYYWDCDNMDLKTIKTVRATCQYGTATEWVYWDGDKPRIINLNVRDAIIDPSLTDPMQLWTDPDNYYTGRRYHSTLDALKKVTIVDPETGDLKARFKNLDRITGGNSTTGEDTDKQVKEMQLGNLTNDKDTIELLEVVDGKRIKTVANRSAIIEDRPNDLGVHYLVINRFIADESVIYGKAIIDPIAHSQELLNDVTNQRTDAVTDALNPQFTLDPVYAAWLPKMKNLPSTGYPFKPGSMQYLVKPRIDGAAFNETAQIKNDIRETTASDQVVKGVASDDKTTATEIRAQVNQAGERFEIYVRMLEKEGLRQRAKIIYKMMLKYLPDTDLVPVQSTDGPKFRKLFKSQLDDSYEPEIRLEASVKSQQQQTVNQATQAYQIIIQDPTNDLWQAKKIMYKKMYPELLEEELDKIIGTTPPTPSSPMQATPWPKRYARGRHSTSRRCSSYATGSNAVTAGD